MSYPGLTQAVVIVTGAARGIGATIAERLWQAGAILELVDIEQAALAHRASILRAAGATVTAHAMDISDPTAVHAMVDNVRARHANIHGLVNVAAVLHVDDLLRQELAHFSHTLQVNVTGTFLMMQAVGRCMAAQGRGAIVTIGSVAGSFPRMHQGAYCASKAAQIMLTQAFGLELAAQGVRCNCVSPGPTHTEMVDKLITQFGSADRFIKGVPEEFRGGIPQGEMIRPDSLANAVLWLLSDAAAQVTLQNISVDGGQSLGR